MRTRSRLVLSFFCVTLVVVLSVAPVQAHEPSPLLPPTGECTDELPVVVASDTPAQSDIYSAVTLAGVLGTDCIVFAGTRDGDFPADQVARLDAASAGGYAVGGTEAVPSAKIANRGLRRISGLDRWATARAVGAETQRLLTEGAEPPPEAGDLCAGYFGLAAHNLADFSVDVYALEVRAARDAWLALCAPSAPAEQRDALCELVLADSVALDTERYDSVMAQFAQRLHGRHCFSE